MFGSRWTRIVVSTNRVLILWYPSEGIWPGEQLRWPHDGIPWYTHESLARCSSDLSLKIDDRLRSRLLEMISHETYFVRSFGIELES